MTYTAIESLRKFVALTEKKRRLEERLRVVKSEIDAIEQEVIDFFAINGITSTKIAGYTVHSRREFWLGYDSQRLDLDRAAEVLAANRSTAWLVKPRYNSSQARSWLSELDTDELGQPILPKELADQGITVSQRIGLSARKG